MTRYRSEFRMPIGLLIRDGIIGNNTESETKVETFQLNQTLAQDLKNGKSTDL